jgi:tetratricopeptide (TPR) repeat protein
LISLYEVPIGTFQNSNRISAVTILEMFTVRFRELSLVEIYDIYLIKKKKGVVMKTKIFLALLMVLCFSFSLYSQNAEELIAKADEICNGMNEMAEAQEALKLYQQAIGLLENKYDAYWRIGRIQYYIGTHTERKKEKKAIFSQGVYWSQKAVELDPEKPDGHYWLGVNNGKFGEVKGVLKSLALVKPVKQSMNKVIELDRSYEDGGADRVLGRVYFKLPGFAGGSKDKSREHLEKSKELGPQDALTRLYLAETLLKFKEVDMARKELDFILGMEDDDRWTVGIDEVKAEAKKMLQGKAFR